MAVASQPTHAWVSVEISPSWSASISASECALVTHDVHLWLTGTPSCSSSSSGATASSPTTAAGTGAPPRSAHGHDMDHYAADAAAVVAHLGLRDVVHVGHSTGGGEVARYVARHGAGRVAKAVLIGAVPPHMVQTESNPEGLPVEVFDGFREAVVTNRSQFYLVLASGPFYGFNRPGADISQGVIQNWWRQGMTGSAQAHYEGIKAFSETDFTDDLRAIDVPTLIMHGDDDQIVPIANSAETAVTLVKNARLKVYPGLSHGMCTP